LFESINRLGESDELAMNFADIYQWEVDFFKEVRPGDRFSIVVEKRFVKVHLLAMVKYCCRFL